MKSNSLKTLVLVGYVALGNSTTPVYKRRKFNVGVVA